MQTRTDSPTTGHVVGPERCEVPVLVGGSREARRLRELVTRIASTPRTTVLVQGEPGSGRRAVAHAIHAASGRSSGPFVVARCHQLDQEHLDAVLRRADGGTLVLEDVERLEPRVQAALADVLDQRSTDADRVDARLIATTRTDLAARVEQGRFREDLDYRLNVLSLRLPALRERPDDVVPIARATLSRIAQDLDLPLVLDDEAARRLTAHGWPGNLRELVAVIELAGLRTAGGELSLSLELDGEMRSDDRPNDNTVGARAVTGIADEATLPLGNRSLRSVEEALIRRVLDEASGNRSAAARVLGVNRTTLYNKIKLYRIA